MMQGKIIEVREDFVLPSCKTNTSLFHKMMMYRPFVPNDPLGYMEKRNVKTSIEIRFNMHERACSSPNGTPTMQTCCYICNLMRGVLAITSSEWTHVTLNRRWAPHGRDPCACVGLGAEPGSLACEICHEPSPAILPLVKLPLAAGADIVNLHFASYRLELLTVARSRDRFRPNDKIILLRKNCCPWTCLEVLWQSCICLSNCKTGSSAVLPAESVQIASLLLAQEQLLLLLQTKHTHTRLLFRTSCRGLSRCHVTTSQFGLCSFGDNPAQLLYKPVR